MPGTERMPDAPLAPVQLLDAVTTSGRAANGQGGNGHAAALRRDLLVSLRRSGPRSPDQLAVGLKASRTGVLQQLRALESAGLVTRRTERHGVGRPRHLYDVTAEAQELFPSNYDGLVAGLLAAIDAVGGEELVERVFEARRLNVGDRIARRLADRLPPDAPLADRVRELAVVQDELGYLASAEMAPDGSILLRECNCAIFQVATELGPACRAELELFREVLGADVVRESHIAAGDRCCSYRVAAPRD